jgi:phenylalanyl-tRNA synthetase beta chain
MKISYSWLKEYLPTLDISPEELARKLQALGFEVSAIEENGPMFSGVVTAQILEIEKHPNADRLSLCKVTDGSETFSVVCGAKNIAVGQKVPLARVGAALPGGVHISRSKIRGVESFGMICSGEELGVSSINGGAAATPSQEASVHALASRAMNAGILILDPAASLGVDFASTLGGVDAVLDIEVTPNRPDCLSHLGFARELSASLGFALKAIEPPQISEQGASGFGLYVESPEDCPSYIGRLIKDVSVAPSPVWLAKKLEAIGIKSINNVVDATNYILMDIGQPLHVFDADMLEGGEIHVRRARAGESILALDDKKYTLNSEILVIADKNQPQAIAGVMGGLHGAVLSKTKRIFLESACFHPPRIRKASQALRLKSESSYRFERGTDPNLPELASRKAAALILSFYNPVSESASKISAPVAHEASKSQPPVIVVSASRINEILGSQFALPDIERVIESLAGASGSAVKKDDAIDLTPPSYRLDLATPADVAEEAARMLGYDKIPSQVSKISARAASQTPLAALSISIRARLKESGLFEAYNYDFVSPKDLSRLGIDSANCPQLANPLSEEMSFLRPTLSIGLLRNAILNFNRGTSSVRLFEIGTTFERTERGVLESHRAAGLVSGCFPNVFWKPARILESDFYGTLGMILDSLSDFSIKKHPFSTEGKSKIWTGLFHPSAAVSLKVRDATIGALGLIHPQTARAWDLSEKEIVIFELDLSCLSKIKPNPVLASPLSSFPVSWRDLSILIKEDISYGSVEDALTSCGIAELRRVDLADLFSGGKIPVGFKSMTLRITLGRDDRTLRDDEVDGAIAKILAKLKESVNADLRAE